MRPRPRANPDFPREIRSALSDHCSSCHVEQLPEYPICVALSKTHKLTRSKKVSLGQLKSQRLTVYRRADYPEYHDLLARLFEPLGRIPEIIGEHDSAPGIIADVEAGHGVALTPSILSWLAGSRLVLRELHPSPAPLVVGIAYSKSHASPSARRFVQVLKVSCAESSSQLRR